MEKGKETKFHSVQNAVQNFRKIKMKQIKISQKEIGKGDPCFIIAEAGVNHNGNLEIAKKMVDAAVEAGVDAVKFQSFKSEELVTKGDGMAEYQQQNVGKQESQLEMLKRLELRQEDFEELKVYCNEKGIMFLTTPHVGGETLDYVDRLIPAFKIGSGDLTNLPFLVEVAGKGKPIILSTGMSTMEEVKEALNLLYKEGNRRVVMLHCTSSYPCKLEDINLRAMISMQEELDCLVGYSDHSQSKSVPIMACALGAVVIEKHFTLDKNMIGPDHKASFDPEELAEMVASIRKLEEKLEGKTLKPEELGSAIENTEEAEKALGSAEKKPVKSEEDILKHARKSIVAAKDIAKGSEIVSEMICIKRPGTGIKPKDLKKVIGKKARHKLKEDSLISWSDLE